MLFCAIPLSNCCLIQLNSVNSDNLGYYRSFTIKKLFFLESNLEI